MLDEVDASLSLSCYLDGFPLRASLGWSNLDSGRRLWFIKQTVVHWQDEDFYCTSSCVLLLLLLTDTDVGDVAHVLPRTIKTVQSGFYSNLIRSFSLTLQPLSWSAWWRSEGSSIFTVRLNFSSPRNVYFIYKNLDFKEMFYIKSLKLTEALHKKQCRYIFLIL